MAGAVEFHWDDAALRAAGPKAFALAANDVRLRAQVLARYPKIRAGIILVGAGRAFELKSTRPEGRFIEAGTRAHTEAPRSGKALKFKTGGFARGQVSHPATAAHPFIRPAVATFGAAFMARAREVFPK